MSIRVEGKFDTDTKIFKKAKEVLGYRIIRKFGGICILQYMVRQVHVNSNIGP